MESEITPVGTTGSIPLNRAISRHGKGKSDVRTGRRRSCVLAYVSSVVKIAYARKRLPHRCRWAIFNAASNFGVVIDSSTREKNGNSGHLALIYQKTGIPISNSSDQFPIRIQSCLECVLENNIEPNYPLVQNSRSYILNLGGNTLLPAWMFVYL